MKKIIILTVIAAVAAGFYFTWRNKKNLEINNHYLPAPVFRGDIADRIDTTGEVEPLNRVEVKPSVSGRIDRLLIEEGDSVKSGQALAWMSSNDRVAILDAARSKGPQEFKYWEDTYMPTPVISPLTGTVILRNVVEGQTVSASDILFALSDNLIVTANTDEADIGMIKLGQKAVITLDAYPDKKVGGTVFQILNEGKNVSNVITYNVKIRPETVPSYFKSQMTANIQILIRNKPNALLLPAYAVQESTSGEKYVLTSNTPQSKPQPAKVTFGLDDGNNVEILAGLSEGDTVYYRAQKYTPQKASSNASPLMMGGKPSKTETAPSKGRHIGRISGGL